MKRQKSKNMKCFRKPLGQMGHFYTPNWAQTIKFLILKICSQDFFWNLHNDKSPSVQKYYRYDFPQKVLVWAKWTYFTPIWA